MLYIRKFLPRFPLNPLRQRLRYGVLPVTAAGLVLAVLFAASPAQAQVTGISYTLSPVGKRVYFSDDAGLDNGFLYGGRLGFGFGEFLQVDGVYLVGNDFSTDFSQLSGDLLSDDVADKEAALAALDALEARDVSLQRYGGRLRLNLGRGGIIPFVTAGTGVLRLDPKGLQESELIYAEAGAGLTFSVADRYVLSVAAETFGYRYNPATTLLTDADLAAAGLSRDNFSQETVYNPTLSASLTFFLGGRSAGELTDIDRALISQFRGGNFRLAVEPFYGQIDFNDALGFASSRAVAGVNAGFDFGPYIGLRAFYWRDTEEEKVFEDGIPSELGDLTFYGGELNLRFDTQLGQRGITPYLILGGGYMDVGKKSDFLGEDGLLPESRYFAIGGGGVEVPLTSSIKLQGGLRGLFMSTEDVEDVSEPSSVFGSLMYTGGINFNIGGSGRTLGTALEGQMAEERAENRRRAESMEAELARIQARLDSLEAARAAMPEAVPVSRPAAEPAEPTAPTEPAAAARPTLVVQRDTIYVPEQRASNLSGQTLTIPVPEEGEIYVRFGAAPATAVETTYAPPMIVGLPTGQMMVQPPAMPATSSTMVPIQPDSAVAGGLSVAQIQQIVRQAVAEQQAQAQGLTAEQFDESLRRMESRIEQRIAQESNRLRADLQEQPRDVVVVQEGGVPASPADTTARRPAGLLNTFSQRQLVGILPFVGVRLGEGTEQFLVGVRGDYRFPERSFRFLPELGLAFSGSIGITAFANVAWAPFDLSTSVRPYFGPGVGFVSDSGLAGLDLALNLFAGLEYTTVNGLTFFGEFSTLDLFDFNRLIVGYRVRL